MDENVVCVTDASIRVSADKHLINTPSLSNKVIHSTYLCLRYFMTAILCQSPKQSIKFKWGVNVQRDSNPCFTFPLTLSV